MAPGYKRLFTTFISNPNSETGEAWASDGGAQQFSRRFGIARLYQRNHNLINTLTSPKTALTTVNEELKRLGADKNARYVRFINEYRREGFPEEEAVARADMLISRELENDLSMMQVKYPYALGGAAAGGWDPVSALLQDSDIGKAPRTFKAISSSAGLGVSGGGISKKEKKRLIAKGKRRARRKVGL